MSRPFETTVYALEADRGPGPWPLLAVLLALTAWGAWMTLATVQVRARGVEARVEVQAVAHGVDAVRSGRLQTLEVEVGQQVQAGMLLATLDDATVRAELVEVEARLAAAEQEASALRRALEAEQVLLAEEEAASRAAVAEQRSQRQHAQLRADHAREETERTRQLVEHGAAAQGEARQSAQTWRERRAEREIASRRVSATRHEARVSVAQRNVAIEELRRALAVAEGREQTEAAARGRLEAELEAHRVRAPIAGVVGETLAATVGSHVEVGDRIATVVPPSAHRVVADFDPADALGRIEVDQIARVHVHGFPWAQYGTVRGRVQRVSRTPRDGRVRVELSIEDDGGIPLAHGQPATVEIEVEAITPLRLLLRALGRGVDLASGATEAS